ncbi:MAG: indole-3-glycerol phosphate synthase TrpC [Candidatus Omnitrophica bacterium]|nr:indole-3-glycerol phosphate synthase TrpC [Candidatus Omnitrophota bacterium]MDD5351902.1 indole-3-glycerol phosphate synthase TrpC [Candidatus Omnitrophota bacterium]MDD5550728.1 indole-3-glycerol phosphate synthase TrpC [Candidatus Omnitrophota bacterium]
MNFLETIIKEKKDFVKQTKEKLSQKELIDKVKTITSKPRFKQILKKSPLHLIAEIKRASPSKGDIRKDLDVIKIAKIYEGEGVELVSVLTEEKFFKGRLEDLSKVKENTKLSILCKDFIIDQYQIYEAKLYGAEAVLLIARILSEKQLKDFIAIAREIDIDTLVEIHDEDDLEKIINLDADIIGINHRNLEDFSIDLKISQDLLPKIPKGKIVIVESGIESAKQIKYYKEIGFNGVLIGESLMRQEDIRVKLQEFISAAR